MKTIYPEVSHGIVNRVQGSIFGYQGWGTVARDEAGTLYAVASGFRVSHICPFGKTVMYISKNEGKTWSPPIVINDTYMDDRDAGILYLGNGRMLVTWFTHSAEAYQTRWYESIGRRAEPAALDATLGMLHGYDHIPKEERLAGSYIRISEDYGMTWGETIRIPISAPHGPTLCRDGSLIYLGLEISRAGTRRSTSTAAPTAARHGGWNRMLPLPIGWVRVCISTSPMCSSYQTADCSAHSAWRESSPSRSRSAFPRTAARAGERSTPRA